MNPGTAKNDGNNRFSGFPTATTLRPWAFVALPRTRDASFSGKDPQVSRGIVLFSLIGKPNKTQTGARGGWHQLWLLATIGA
jgi:hypothetical protein